VYGAALWALKVIVAVPEAPVTELVEIVIPANGDCNLNVAPPNTKLPCLLPDRAEPVTISLVLTPVDALVLVTLQAVVEALDARIPVCPSNPPSMYGKDPRVWVCPQLALIPNSKNKMLQIRFKNLVLLNNNLFIIKRV
jgi:hypothetical protein